MSELLQKDQIVACWDREDCDKTIRIYIGKEGMVHRCRLPGIEHGDPDFELWEYCVPLEELAPEAFLARERRSGEQATEVMAMESDLVQRLRRQIRWLCQELAPARIICPSVSAIASCDNDCPRCWEQASRKAVEDANNG